MKKVLVSLALLAIVAGAQATTFDWGAHDSAESHLSYVPAGAFSDIYTFSLGNAETTASSAVSLNLSSAYVISGAQYSLWKDAGAAGPDGSDTMIGTWSFDGTSGTAANAHTVDLVAGNYFYAVSGTALGSGDAAQNAGIYNIASTIAAVPEPETYALMLGGLIAVGSICARRRKRS
ncbi:MAG TPA: FxDxF family PEP-CTERM protein [Burkholderiaceae bacterium]|jgi:hypothetical protein